LHSTHMWVGLSVALIPLELCRQYHDTTCRPQDFRVSCFIALFTQSRARKCDQEEPSKAQRRPRITLTAAGAWHRPAGRLSNDIAPSYLHCTRASPHPPCPPALQPNKHVTTSILTGSPTTPAARSRVVRLMFR
jgi:hypothetical protein